MILRTIIILTLIISCGNNSAQDYFPSMEGIPNEADVVLSELNLMEKIGQLLIIQLRYDESGTGIIDLSEAEINLLRAIQPGGVILFKENMDSVPQLMELISDITQNISHPPFIALDEEGGSVSRLVRSGNIPATTLPSASRIAASGNERSAYLAYSIIGRELSALGFNMNFAPVADIFSNPGNELIASRSFGTDPEQVSAMVTEGVRALQEQQVISVIKHFPGHGEVSGDSHFVTPLLEHDLKRLMDFEIQPFLAGMQADVGGFLMAHISVPKIDSLPASLSPVFITTIIRKTMDYEGLVITDALEMKGIGSLPSHDTGIMALQAGADILLIPPDPFKQRDAILAALLERRLAPEAIDRAVSRIISAKLDHNIRPGKPPLSEAEVYKILGSEEHEAMLRRALQ